MNYEPRDTLISVHLISAGIYILYFAIYYGRYSRLNQKLNGILKIEKAGVANPEIVEQSKLNTNRKIRKWRRRCYLPIPFIGILHFIALYQVYPVYQLSEYLIILYVAIGGSLLIAMGNFTKGAQIFDPNRKFTNTGNRWN